MDVTTTLISENENGAVYRVVFPRSRGGEPGEPLALEFSVTSRGCLGFDNRQPGARACAKRRVSRLLAEEMTRTARERVPGALGGRTEKGLAFELRVHNRAHRLGFRPDHAVTAEMGSPYPAAPDYDNNAAWFEHPVRQIPLLLKLLRGSR